MKFYLTAVAWHLLMVILEAIFNFNLALERFREYLIKFHLIKRLEVSYELFEKMWKGMANQSERQRGAYQLLHTLIYNDIDKFPQKYSEIRNDAIHKGEIPSKENTREFGEFVFNEIKKFLSNIEIRDFMHYTVVTFIKKNEGKR